ncbi:MAG: IgGFc-binding protein, partial [Planctomycetales bacterium]|nr:IgGFc-binding protein [Planctomycetales bacterium]
RWACDHLEETMFPVEALGKETLISATRPLRQEPNLVRVVSVEDDNAIVFSDPALAPVTLQRGEYVEFETSTHTKVSGAKAFSAVQFLVGQDYDGFGSSGGLASGDPAMSIGTPLEQHRVEYAFLAPKSYTLSFVNIVAPLGVQIFLDERPIRDFQEVAGTNLGVAQVQVSSGTHRVDGTAPFGISVYGFGTYTSYLVPGGLDFRDLGVLY